MFIHGSDAEISLPSNVVSLPPNNLERSIAIESATVEDLRQVAALRALDPLPTVPRFESLESLQRLLKEDPRAIQVARVAERIVGFAIGGSLGARGIVSSVWVDADYRNVDVGITLEKRIMNNLSNQGVHRAHAFPTSAAFDDTAAWAERGFKICTGEALLQISCSKYGAPVSILNAPEKRLNALLTCAAYTDLAQIIQLGSTEKTLAFQPWENLALLERMLQKDSASIQVAKIEDRVVGFVIAGSLGDVGTLSHVWIHEDFRDRKLGTALQSQMLSHFGEIGVKHIHLMITAGEGFEKRKRFWTGVGFDILPDQIFLERDF